MRYALQAAPRAPWSRIGRALGVDATTAAHRWERLRANGLAWISVYDSAKSATVAHIEPAPGPWNPSAPPWPTCPPSAARSTA
ncbi:AsnC family protein [Streptomyces sp. NPDC054866]